MKCKQYMEKLHNAGLPDNAANADLWSDNAVKGYLLKTLRAIGEEPEQIRRAMWELSQLLESMSLEEAEEYFDEYMEV